MVRKRPITAFGWEIKRKLVEMKLDQRAFCQLYDIPENRLGELITGARKAVRYREKVERLLNIRFSEQSE
nr:XRE family transcriptional regulator [Paenibacillus taihuensis]